MASAAIAVQPQLYGLGTLPYIMCNYVLIRVYNLEPSENWDDDFEFQSENHKNGSTNQQRRQRQLGHGVGGVDAARKMSIASSAALEDWDVEEGPSSTATHAMPESSAVASSLVLNDHAETENWDDDFEDARNSPKKLPSTTPQRRILGDREESWDDELDLEDDDPDDSAEFGMFAEREEDRTVTARSRRAALQRLSSTPPPPLPFNRTETHQLPSPFVAGSNHPYPHPYRQQQPFPQRSPTSSVFSVPNTVTTHHTYSSTTHLRPTSAFALLPPSPPIYKARERERRRLRKKSRPKPQGAFELSSIAGGSGSDSRHGHNRFSFSDDGEHCSPEVLPEQLSLSRRAETPGSELSSIDMHQQRQILVPIDTTSTTSSIPVPQTPIKGAALLSRIGSVKKWGVRRRRGDSTTPAEVTG